jgi:phosphofructokinase-like protein
MQYVGVLTSGGDCPGLNAALRAIGKSGMSIYGMKMIGFMNGFRGLVHDQSIDLDLGQLSSILTDGGTILGTSRDKPHRMKIDGKVRDMTDVIVETCQRRHLDALVCIGGGGTQKNALRLKESGLNVITLPKTIDNDIARNDISFGFDTARSIATEAIDRLHSTATSHNRIIVVEVMGHRAGWLALESGIAGGADVILIPEIPYDIDNVAAAIRLRTRRGKRFSIVVVAEGSASKNNRREMELLVEQKRKAASREDKQGFSGELDRYRQEHVGNTIELARNLEELTGLESRLTILGHLQRGGTPSAFDRVLATRLGTQCAKFIHECEFGVLLAVQQGRIVPVPLEDVAGEKKLVTVDHPLVKAARDVGTCFGD